MVYVLSVYNKKEKYHRITVSGFPHIYITGIYVYSIITIMPFVFVSYLALFFYL